MIYRLLPREEWPRVKDILADLGQLVPEHESSRIAVCEKDSEIIGVHCLHPQLHGEPVWIHPNERGNVNFLRMKDCLTNSIPKDCPFYVFSPNRVISQMAGLAGMKRLPWEVWKGVA